MKISTPVFPALTINAADFITQDTTGAIQAAINTCASHGGGCVLVPPGDWFTGPIHLTDNIHLKLSEGSILRFSTQYKDYLPVVFTRWEGMECYNYSPLIYAKDCRNIAITGKGTLIGGGEAWWHFKEQQQEAARELCYAQSRNIPVEKRIYGTETAALRPSFIQFIGCRNILLDDFTVLDGPQWTLHPVYCENVLIRNLTVSTHGHNTDGLNPDSCCNVMIEGCTFNTGDDCIAINSGMNEDGWRIGKPCENIEIKNCTMLGGHGGIVIGSAISGGIRNIYAHDCTIRGTMQGIRIKSMRGRGGYIDNAIFENIDIRDVSHQAIQINMFYEFSTVQPLSDTPSDCRNITIRHITGLGAATGIEIRGLPEKKLQSITMENIHLTADEAFLCSNAENLSLENITITKNGGLS